MGGALLLKGAPLFKIFLEWATKLPEKFEWNGNVRSVCELLLKIMEYGMGMVTAAIYGKL